MRVRLVVLATVIAACGSTTEPTATPTTTPTSTSTSTSTTSAAPASSQPADAELFPDVVGASATRDPDGTWRFDVTLSSPYDTPARYADAWRVLTPDGIELGVRVLTHDHANEQPFTRSLSGVEIPADIDTVTIEGRDQISGWGGATVEVTLAR